MNKLRLFFLLFGFSVFLSCQEVNSISKDYAQITNSELETINKPASSIDQSADYQVECPLEGSAKTDRLKQLNILKNRTKLDPGNNYNAKVSLAGMLEKGNDTDRWSHNTYVKVVGYVKDVKVGGVETVNCKAKEKDLRDTHIDLCLEPNSYEKSKNVIAEITPRLRKMMLEKGIDWRTSTIRDKYLGRWVEVEGWLLYDSEHANMAENTNPGNEKNWRATAWEIHPIISIKTVEKH